MAKTKPLTGRLANELNKGDVVLLTADNGKIFSGVYKCCFGYDLYFAVGVRRQIAVNFNTKEVSNGYSPYEKRRYTITGCRVLKKSKHHRSASPKDLAKFWEPMIVEQELRQIAGQIREASYI